MTSSSRHRIDVRSYRGYSRLVLFLDAVAAIAITLLILPLVTKLNSLRSESSDNIPDLVTFFSENWMYLVVFLATFNQIFWLWWVNHKLFEKLAAYDSVVLLYAFVWTLTVVFLPFPTEWAFWSAGGDGARVSWMLLAMLLVVNAMFGLYLRAKPRLLNEQIDQDFARDWLLYVYTFRFLLFALPLLIVIPIAIFVDVSAWFNLVWLAYLPYPLVLWSFKRTQKKDSQTQAVGS